MFLFYNRSSDKGQRFVVAWGHTRSLTLCSFAVPSWLSASPITPAVAHPDPASWDSLLFLIHIRALLSYDLCSSSLLSLGALFLLVFTWLTPICFQALLKCQLLRVALWRNATSPPSSPHLLFSFFLNPLHFSIALLSSTNVTFYLFIFYLFLLSFSFCESVNCEDKNFGLFCLLMKPEWLTHSRSSADMCFKYSPKYDFEKSFFWI